MYVFCDPAVPLLGNSNRHVYMRAPADRYGNVRSESVSERSELEATQQCNKMDKRGIYRVMRTNCNFTKSMNPTIDVNKGNQTRRAHTIQYYIHAYEVKKQVKTYGVGSQCGGSD